MSRPSPKPPRPTQRAAARLAATGCPVCLLPRACDAPVATAVSGAAERVVVQTKDRAFGDAPTVQPGPQPRLEAGRDAVAAALVTAQGCFAAVVL